MDAPVDPAPLSEYGILGTNCTTARVCASARNPSITVNRQLNQCCWRMFKIKTENLFGINWTCWLLPQNITLSEIIQDCWRGLNKFLFYFNVFIFLFYCFL